MYWNGATQLYGKGIGDGDEAVRYNPDQGRNLTRVPGMPWYPAFGDNDGATALRKKGGLKGLIGKIRSGVPQTPRTMPLNPPILDDRGYGGAIPAYSPKENFRRSRISLPIPSGGDPDLPIIVGNASSTTSGSKVKDVVREAGLGSGPDLQPPWNTVLSGGVLPQTRDHASGMATGRRTHEPVTLRGHKLYVGGLSFLPEIGDEVLVTFGYLADMPIRRPTGPVAATWDDDGVVIFGYLADMPIRRPKSTGAVAAVSQYGYGWGLTGIAERPGNDLMVSFGYIADMPIRRPRQAGLTYAPAEGEHGMMMFGYIADMPIRRPRVPTFGVGPYGGFIGFGRSISSQNGGGYITFGYLADMPIR